MSPTELLDIQVLEGLREMGSDEFLGQMIDLYLESTRSVPSALQAQVAAQDWKGVEFSAHSLKSGSGNLGLTALTASASALESAAKRGDGDLVRQLAAAVPALHEASCAALVEYRPGA